MKSSKLYMVGMAVITTIAAVIISCEKDEDSKPPMGITNRIDIKADSIKNILYRDAKAYGSVGDYKNITFSQYGHCWDTLETPTIDNNKTEFQNLTAKSVFTSNLSNLKPNKTYYLRSYAKTNSITVYSEIVNFQTRALEAPVVTTDSSTQIASTSANIWGAIALDGGTDISAKGVCWGITENPTLQNQHAEFTGAQDTFKVPLTGLEKYTTYYARIYAVNQTGTGYGNIVTFKTLAEQPQLTTAEVTSISAYTATGGGTITSNGGAEITTRGICWGLDPNPTISNNQCVASVGTDNYTCNLTNLQPGKVYHVRAFATNVSGTAYGNDVTFTTPPVLPSITTIEVTNITATNATTGGNVTDDGGATTTERGVCWSTSQNPTILDSKTNNGEGLGVFSSNITGLSAGVTYYVRAYATNTVGTSYGHEVSFITKNGVISLSTTSITAITPTTAISGGIITDDGGATITTRGVCWSTLQYPTISDNHTSDNSGVGTFTSEILGLTRTTTYYLRAYATNSIGTVYGNQQIFNTIADLPTLTTIVVTNITANSATSGGNITDDGGATIIARGICWSTSINPLITDNKTSDNIGTGFFSSSLIGLIPNTTYHVRAYATNSSGISYGNDIQITTIDGAIDIEGNGYNIVNIGTQVWMLENLKTTKYRDGSSIPNVTDNDSWMTQTTGAYCWYNNDSTTYKATYGALYNWYTVVDSRNLCPIGWHVPSDAEWGILQTYLGGGEIAGGKLKSTLMWNSPNLGATNESGFTALPSGFRRDNNGLFTGIGDYGAFWSTSLWSSDINYAIGGSLSYDFPYFNRGYSLKPMGRSVRCIKD